MKARQDMRIVIRDSKDAFVHQFGEIEYKSQRGIELTAELNKLLFQLNQNLVAKYEECEDI